jgi:two-component system sensor kinase FixL
VFNWGLHPWLEDRGFFLILIPAVLLAAGFGGLGPGLLATALSVALGVLLIGVNLSQPTLLEALSFTIVGGGISWFGEQLRRSRIRDATHTQHLRAREAHLRSILNAVPDGPW